MKIIYSVILTLALLFSQKMVFSQKSKEYKKNQLEIGICFGGNTDNFGLNSFYKELNSGFYPYSKIPFMLLENFNLTYKRNFKQKHFLIADIFRFSGTRVSNKDWYNGFSYQSASVGYGYLLPIKKVQGMVFASIPYRYNGGETVMYGGFGGDFNIHWTQYNSIGLGTGLDVNYFLTENWALGAKMQYNYFPFDQEKLNTGTNFDASYEQMRGIFFAQFKLAYQFNLWRKNITN